MGLIDAIGSHQVLVYKAFTDVLLLERKFWFCIQQFQLQCGSSQEVAAAHKQHAAARKQQACAPNLAPLFWQCKGCGVLVLLAFS